MKPSEALKLNRAAIREVSSCVIRARVGDDYASHRPPRLAWLARR